MAVSKVKVTFKVDIEKVWNIVTSLTNYSWRSDLSKIDIVNDNQFIEYTKEGFATTFTTTLKEPCQRWEFDMENENMKGHWQGVFIQKGDITEIELIENVEAKKMFMKPFVKGYLKKQQAVYIADLKKALACL